MLKQWSIGIYETDNPLKPEEIKGNPVLTYKNVKDICAGFVADPFLFYKDDKFYLFFEVLNTKNNLGEIGVATSVDAVNWEYECIVLKSEFHLSYPFVFQNGEDIFMIPECYKSGKVTIYKAENFPFEWKPVKNILAGPYVDSTLLNYDDTFYLFTYLNKSDESENYLEIWFSDKIDGNWEKHPASPVSCGKNFPSRPGGRIIEFEGELYRFAQDTAEYYGKQIHCFRITELTRNTFRQEKLEREAFLTATGRGWNAIGMHNFDVIRVNGKFICCADGLSESLFVDPRIIINKLIYKIKKHL